MVYADRFAGHGRAFVSCFSVVDWVAWQPGVLSREQWRNWQSQGQIQKSAELPDFKVIPPLLRRRLSLFGRVTFSLMDRLIDTHGAMPIVHVSQHGEVHRTIRILDEIATGNSVSPTDFSLSVHNSVVGMLSIHRGIKEGITAIAAGAESLVPVLLEAGGLLAEDHESVLCVVSDEPVPERYAHYAPRPAIPFVVAFVVGSGHQYSLYQQGDDALCKDDCPQALAFMRYVLSPEKELRLTHNRSGWAIKKDG